MTEPKNKCYNCKHRHVGCHIECADYLEFKAQHEALRKEKQKALLDDVLVVERVREKARLQAMRKKRRGR